MCKSPPYRHVLEASTGHLMVGSFDRLERLGTTSILSGDCGLFVWIPSDVQMWLKYPSEVRAIFGVCRIHYPEASYILFDGDAPENENFKSYAEDYL